MGDCARSLERWITVTFEEGQAGPRRAYVGICFQRSVSLFPKHPGLCVTLDAVPGFILGGFVNQESVGHTGGSTLVPKFNDSGARGRDYSDMFWPVPV